jgi:hypothetical protein
VPAGGAVLRGVWEQAGIGEGLNCAMTFKAIVQDGLIIVNTHGTVPDGTAVEVEIVRKTKARAKPAARKPKGKLPGFGMWAHRKDLEGDDPVKLLRAKRRERRLG